jgi:hypothetical protein
MNATGGAGTVYPSWAHPFYLWGPSCSIFNFVCSVFLWISDSVCHFVLNLDLLSFSWLITGYLTRISRWEATNTNFIIFGLTRPGFEPIIYHNPGEHANHYNTDVVVDKRQRTKLQTLCRKLKIEQHEPYKSKGWTHDFRKVPHFLIHQWCLSWYSC